MKKILETYRGSMTMRLLLIPLIVLILFLAVAEKSQAQVIGCADLVKSSRDIVRMVSTIGKPGDTVLIPVTLKTDSIVTAFQFLIQYDTTVLRPIFIVDSVCTSTDSAGNCLTYSLNSSFVDYVIHNRFVKTDTSGPFNEIIDTITLFSANLFQGMEDVVACNFLPSFIDIDSLMGDSSGEPIFSIKFLVNPTTPHNTLSRLTFFESDIFTVNDTVVPPDTTFFPGCNESQLTTVWFDGVITQSFQVFPTSNTTTQMLFRADTGLVVLPNPTISLNSSTTTAAPGGQIILTWNATNADSVIVTGSATQLPFGTIALSSSLTITAPSVDGTYSYTATAKQNGGTTASAVVTVTVSGGGGGGGNGPAITFTPVDQSYTIDQGQTVSFAVFASETDGDQVTLSASSLPNNAVLAPTNPIIGTGSASGTFSFTPDFNQVGPFVMTFTSVDKDGTSKKSVTIVVNELQIDRLFTTSAIGQRPSGGLRGARTVLFPINLVTSKTVYGVQFDMRYPKGITTVDSFVVSGRIPDYVVYDNIGLVPGNVRVLTFGLASEPVMSDTTTAILWAAMSLSDTAKPWTSYPIIIENGKEAVSPDPNIGSLDLTTSGGVVEVDSLGDVNLDRSIDVADAVNIVASIVQTYSLTIRQFATADVLPNDSVNVFDLVAMVNMIYGIPLPAPSPELPVDGTTIFASFGDMSVGGSDVITISSEGIPEEIAGVQIEVSYNPDAVELGTPGITADDDKFAISYRDDGNGHMKVVLYHVTPFKTAELIQAGSADLVYVPVTARTDVKGGDNTTIRITEALFSTGAALSVPVGGVYQDNDLGLPTSFVLEQNYPNPFNPETNISFSISENTDVTLTVFNVLGQEVATLQDGPMDAGHHTVVWNATSSSGQRISTGVYLYRLKVGGESETRKMLLLK